MIDSDLGYWLAGFIDGEGSFGIVTLRATTFQCRFSLTLRDDDRAILESLHAITQLGHLTPQKARGGSKPQLAWVIDSKMDCQELVCILDRFPLRTKKIRDYLVWRAAVLEWCRAHGRSRTDEYRDRMASLKAELSEGRTYKPVSGYT